MQKAMFLWKGILNCSDECLISTFLPIIFKKEGLRKRSSKLLEELGENNIYLNLLNPLQGGYMKKVVLVFTFFMFVVISVAYAGEKAPLGAGNVTLKVNYINFTDDVIGNSDVDTGVYVGIEGFGEIADSLYLGGEIGYAYSKGSVEVYFNDVDTKLTFVPVEVNLKYAVKAGSNFVLDAGAGASYNYVKEKAASSSDTASASDWLLGGQLFFDANYTMDKFFAGINGQYQITEDFKDASYDYSNWRVGGQVGFMF